MQAYIKTALCMLEATPNQELTCSLEAELNIINHYCSLAGGSLRSRQVIALAIAHWNSRYPQPALKEKN